MTQVAAVAASVLSVQGKVMHGRNPALAYGDFANEAGQQSNPDDLERISV